MAISYGSRQHILDLVDSGAFPAAMTTLLTGTGVQVRSHDTFAPAGSSNPKEATLQGFVKQARPQTASALQGWWVTNGKNPTWDLLSTCSVNGADGLLLVEAKAHESELHYSGKPLSSSPSQGTQQNHASIRKCIMGASAALGSLVPGVNISIGSRYQLSNRVASAVKLAECGEHAVLLYLGFIGDEHFPDCFMDTNHWQRVMGAYMKDVLPLSLPEQTIEFPSGGSLLFIARAM